LLYYGQLGLISPTDYIIVNILKYDSVMNLISLSTNEISKENIYKVVFIVPVIEEILFRLILKPSRLNIGIFSFFFLFYILIGKNNLHENLINHDFRS